MVSLSNLHFFSQKVVLFAYENWAIDIFLTLIMQIKENIIIKT